MKLKPLFATLFAASLLLRSAGTAFGENRPKAYVYDFKDPWTEAASASRLLEEAGFEVKPLPLDRSPFELLESDLIFFGSFVTEHPEYREYMRKYKDALYNYVDKGKIVMHMTQADQTESEPPFLPTTHGARRRDDDFAQAFVLNPDNPLLKGIEFEGGKLQLDVTSTVWESFVEHGGFEVMIAGDKDARFPALMEGAYGQGRIILAAMFFDKDVPRTEEDPHKEVRQAFNRKFFQNLRTHAINVRERNTQPLKITPSAATSTRYVPGSWTLAVLPDTQVYSLRFPGMFLMQTSWLRDQKDRLDIRYVLHLGDVVNNNTQREWNNAHRAMAQLDGVVPYAMVPGNHDYGPSGDASTRDTLMNDVFPLDNFRDWPTFGGAMEKGKLDNTFHLFEAGGIKWIVIALEWGPRDSTIEWANKVMEDHDDRMGIFITHAYMNNNDFRYDHKDTGKPQHYNPHEYRTPGGVNDGEELWNKLIKKHKFCLTLNGHVLGDGTGYRSDRTDQGNVCHQILANYQIRQFGGEGYMRLLEFRPDGKTVQVKTYSPLYDRFLLEPDHHFSLDLGDIEGPKQARKEEGNREGSR